MADSISQIAAIIAALSASFVLLFSTLLVFRLRRHGGIERFFARVVVDSKRRRDLLRAMSMVNGMFLLTGGVFAATMVGLIPDPAGELLSALVFAGGTICMLYQTALGVRNSTLTLEHELDLRDFAPEVYGVVVPREPSLGAPVASDPGSYWASPSRPEGPIVADDGRDRLY